MTVPILCVATVPILIGLSVRANARFRTENRLPMQWSLSGSVNWTAPRILALSFTPVLAIAVLALFTAASMTMRPGPEGQVVPALIALGACLVAAHVLHLWLIGRTLARKG